MTTTNHTHPDLGILALRLTLASLREDHHTAAVLSQVQQGLCQECWLKLIFVMAHQQADIITERYRGDRDAAIRRVEGLLLAALNEGRATAPKPAARCRHTRHRQTAVLATLPRPHRAPVTTGRQTQRTAAHDRATPQPGTTTSPRGRPRARHPTRHPQHTCQAS